MPDYLLLQKEQTVRAVNVVRQDQQDALLAEGYTMIWDEIRADNADAALLRYQQLRKAEDGAAQNFAMDSTIGGLIHLLTR